LRITRRNLFSIETLAEVNRMSLISDSVLRHVPGRAALESLGQAFADYPQPNFRVRLWDGATWGASENPRFTLVVKHPNALRQMFLSPSELTLGECYVRDQLDVEGDMEAAVEMGEYLLAQEPRSLPASLTLANIMGKIPGWQAESDRETAEDPSSALHSQERDRQAISYHYDLPAEFFALWLDERRMYSCAYFEDKECDLDTAQRRKLDYLCRKLRLRSGERLLDIGCGWGGLMIHAAAHYGVQALGITLSVPQAEVARQRIREVGLNDRCRVELCDYRDLELEEQFDKISSIGMFEHVGETQLPEYFSRVWHLLRSGGVFINSGISASFTYRRRGPSFIDRYVFPDGDLVPVSTSLHAAEMCNFEVRDVESLREHYALTLRHWVRRLEANSEDAIRVTNPMTYRIWRLYMAASAHAFSTGRINLHHALLFKPRQGRPPYAADSRGLVSRWAR
jgi:cyclopropane-fatty-acyl-phospholipid synthase